jgi:hypothetical protein
MDTGPGTQMVFTGPGGPFYVNEPTTQDVLGASGAFATGNATELGIEVVMDAAFNRHVIDNAANLNNPAAFYQTGPANYYAAFWHQVNLNSLAYGFPYDDDDNQSDLLVSTANARGLAITLSGCIPTPTNTATNTATHTATNTATKTDTNTFTNTATNTATHTITNTVTQTATSTLTHTVTSTVTLTITQTFTNTMTNTVTNTMTDRATITSTSTNTAIFTESPTSTNSTTTTNSPTNTVTLTSTLTATATNTNTLGLITTDTHTPTATYTDSPTLTTTNTFSSTVTTSFTFSPTTVFTFTNTATYTNSVTPIATNAFSPTTTLTETATKIMTATLTPTTTTIATYTPTATPIPGEFFISKNVFTPDSPVQIRVGISQFPGHYDLTVYNSAGENIKTIDSQYISSAFSRTYNWDGTNKFGNKCASGIYVIYLTEPLKRLLGRVVLIR